jgi:hypothetical protein
MAPDRTGRRLAGVVVAATAAAGTYFLVMGFADPGRLISGAASPAARLLGDYEAVRTVVLVGAAVWLLLAAALVGAAWRLVRQPASRPTRGLGHPGRDPRRRALLMGGPRFRRAQSR